MSEINKDVIAKALNDPNFSFIESFADASEPEIIKKEMTRLMFLHRKEREILKKRERERVVINSRLERKKREAYLNHKDAPNEKTKTVLVEIDTEEDKYELDIIDQKIKEINRSLQAIKLELDTLKSVSYTVRTSMGTF